MGYQTKLHLAQQSAPLQWGRRPQSSAHSKAAWLGSSAVAESPQVPTRSQRGCGAREVIRQWKEGSRQGNKRIIGLLTAIPQVSVLHVPLFLPTASSFSPHFRPLSPHIPCMPTCFSPTCLALSLTVWLKTVQMTPWAQGGVVRDPSYRK